MTSFNIKRFWNVAKWELTYHRSDLTKQLLTGFSVSFLFIMFFNWVNYLSGDVYTEGTVLWYATLILVCLFSGSFILSKVKTRQQRLDMLMLPGSTLEKFVARYLMSTLVMMVIGLVSFLAADLLQYLLMLVLKPAYAVFQESMLFQDVAFPRVDASNNVLAAAVFITFFWWYHSLYLLGGVFFRKRSWLWTTLVLILVFNVLVFGTGYAMLFGIDLIFPNGISVELLDGYDTLWNVFYFGVMLGLTAFNYWLSYRLFHRLQLINNKFVNV